MQRYVPSASHVTARRLSNVTNSRVRREPRQRRHTLLLLAESIAVAVHSGNEAFAELATQLMNVDGDGVALDRRRAAVDHVFQMRAGDYPSLSLHQGEQGAIFMNAEAHGLARTGDDASRRIDRDISV